MKIQYGLRAILILVLAAGMFMSGWVANDSYRTLEAKRQADEAAKQASQLPNVDNAIQNVQIEYIPDMGISIKGDPVDVQVVENAIEKLTSESNVDDVKAIEKIMSGSSGK